MLKPFFSQKGFEMYLKCKHLGKNVNILREMHSLILLGNPGLEVWLKW
jgi:hypothetical protein